MALANPVRPWRDVSGVERLPAARKSPLGGASHVGPATVTANIPAADLARARAFYADKLGLSPTQEMEGIALQYRTAAGSAFSVYQTEFAGQAGHTIAQWHVDDVDAEVRDLKGKGVAFEHYDMPGVTWDDDVATLGDMGKAAWFRDSENNILCIDDGVPGGEGPP